MSYLTLLLFLYICFETMSCIMLKSNKISVPFNKNENLRAVTYQKMDRSYNYTSISQRWHFKAESFLN